MESMLDKYKMMEEYRDLEEIKLKNGKDLLDEFKNFQELYSIMKEHISKNKWIHFEENEITVIFSEKLLVTFNKISKLLEEISSYIDWNSKKNNIPFEITNINDLEKLKKINFLLGGFYWHKTNDNIDSSLYWVQSGHDYNGLGIYSIEEFIKSLDNRSENSKLESKELKIFEIMLNYNLVSYIVKNNRLIEKFEDLVDKYRIYKNYISYIKEDGSIIFDREKILDSIENKKENLFDAIKITYKENGLVLESKEVFADKKIYNFKNKQKEVIFTIKDGVEKSVYYYDDNEFEEREYKEGVLQGVAVYTKDGVKKRYFYNNGVREKMPKLKYYLSIDKERINIDDYRENRLLDPNVGHWDLKEEDREELKELLGKNVYSRDPKLDINQGGIVGIDFGTKSTVVVYQKDTNNILPMRISGEELNKEARDTDYENPTVIEFRDLIKFKKDYDEEIGRPNTKWEDVTISHIAFRHLMEGTSEQFDSIISDIKQWTVNKNGKIEVIDKKGNKISLPSYLDLDKNSENYIDPVEIYAYYIGSYINTMRNGIYLEYYLSFPVTYEKSIREKILKSFEKGIKKSLPKQIQEDEKIMKKFRVKHGSNEPAAYAVCALKKLKIEPEENEKVYYGVFDFGGGTTDFDFGIWKNSEDEDMYDYELEHFGAGGDIHLGGENILKELAYKVFSNNTSELRKRKIQYVRPEWCYELPGEEILVENTREAKLNTRKLAE